jgi:hypothetical protein
MFYIHTLSNQTLSATPPDEPKRIVAKSLHLVDSKGRVYCEIAEENDVPTIRLGNNESKNIILITIEKDGGFMKLLHIDKDSAPHGILMHASNNESSGIVVGSGSNKVEINCGRNAKTQITVREGDVEKKISNRD